MYIIIIILWLSHKKTFQQIMKASLKYIHEHYSICINYTAIIIQIWKFILGATNSVSLHIMIHNKQRYKQLRFMCYYLYNCIKYAIRC